MIGVPACPVKTFCANLDCMSGSSVLGLIALSVAWLFVIGGLIVNFRAWLALLRAKDGERVPSGYPFIPGVVGSACAFLSIPLLQRHAGIEVPWPFAWIVLPFFLDMYGPGGFVLALCGFARKEPLRAPEEPPELPEVSERTARTARRADAAIGCLLGTAVGDALGLPCEGLSKSRQRRWYPVLDRYRLVFGRGMCSDDTDHACMLAQALTVSGGNARRFASSLAWRFRFWLLSLPAGVGFATLRSILKLWLLIPPQISGVRSAGNGPAMRSALLGVCFAEDEAALVLHTAAATVITHRDPKAECGALAVALAARSSLRAEDARAYLIALRRFAAPFGEAGGELVSLAERAGESAARGESTEQFAEAIGCARGVTGFMYHSVPVALHAWFAHPRDFAAAVTAAIRCGGDTDTVAAITGAIVGAGVGKRGIPERWLAELWDWPRGIGWMGEAARRAVEAAEYRVRGSALRVSPGLLPRNLLFLLIVLAHGFRRLAPPY